MDFYKYGYHFIEPNPSRENFEERNFQVVKEEEDGFFYSFTSTKIEEEVYEVLEFFWYDFAMEKSKQLGQINKIQSEEITYYYDMEISKDSVSYFYENKGELFCNTTTFYTKEEVLESFGNHTVIYWNNEFVLLREVFTGDVTSIEYQKGSFEKVYFYDRKEKKSYPITDERIVLSQGEILEVKAGVENYLIFSRTAMTEAYELEECYDKQIPKGKIFWKGYLTGIYYINYEVFLDNCRTSSKEISLKQIQETDYGEITELHGEKEGAVYFSKIDCNKKAYEVKRFSLEMRKEELITKIDYSEYGDTYNLRTTLFPFMIIKATPFEEYEENRVFYPESLIVSLDGRETIMAINEKIILSWLWEEDEEGENYSEYIVVRDKETKEEIERFEGTGYLLKDEKTIVL